MARNKKNMENLTPFSKKNQPDPKLKSKGHKEKALLKNIANQLVTGDAEEIVKNLAKFLGVEVENIDVETAMHIKMMQKVLQDGDVRAYNSIMDRIKGKPKQEIDTNIKVNDLKGSIPIESWIPKKK